jgi:hypothetical protein
MDEQWKEWKEDARTISLRSRTSPASAMPTRRQTDSAAGAGATAGATVQITKEKEKWKEAEEEEAIDTHLLRRS